MSFEIYPTFNAFGGPGYVLLKTGDGQGLSIPGGVTLIPTDSSDGFGLLKSTSTGAEFTSFHPSEYIETTSSVRKEDGAPITVLITRAAPLGGVYEAVGVSAIYSGYSPTPLGTVPTTHRQSNRSYPQYFGQVMAREYTKLADRVTFTVSSLVAMVYGTLYLYSLDNMACGLLAIGQNNMESVAMARIEEAGGTFISKYQNGFFEYMVNYGEEDYDCYSDRRFDEEFYLSKPIYPLFMSRGESVELEFSLNKDGVLSENVPFTYENSQPDATGTVNWRIDGNTLTITNECWYSNGFIRFRSTEYPELEYELEFRVTNPVQPPNPYTPGSGAGGGSGLPTGSGGGGGTFPSGPGPSMVETIPTGQTGNDLANSGLFTMYLMNQSYMNLIGDIMWEDNLGIQALKAVFGQPIDAIISTMSYPFDLTNFVTKTAQNLFFGPWNSGLPFQALTKSSFQIDWGTITIPFGWGNFLDYAPHTKMELFLPWGPGYVPIDPNDVSPYSNTPGNFNVSTFTNGSIQVKTNIELGKGTCVHNVIGNNGKVIGSYSGVVGKQVPMTALDTGGKLITTIGAVATMTAGAATAAGAMAGKFNTGQMSAHKQVDPLLNRPMFADAGYMQKASEGVSTVNRGANMAASALLSNPISFPRAGTFSDGSSAMTVQQPFLLISRPVQSVPTQYGHYNGYPSNIHYANLSGLSGYTEISEIHLDNVTATADELAELDGVLKGGILL